MHSRQRTERSAVGSLQRKLSDQLSVKDERSAVGSQVGSGGSSAAFASGLSPAPMVTSPAPASSNPACGCRDRSAAHVALGSGGLPTAFAAVLSRRLPWLMTPQAPLRSRTVGFPESGSDLGSARHFPGAGLPRPLKAQAMARIHPQIRQSWPAPSLRGPSSPRYPAQCPERPGSSEPPSAQGPFA